MFPQYFEAWLSHKNIKSIVKCHKKYPNVSWLPSGNSLLWKIIVFNRTSVYTCAIFPTFHHETIASHYCG